MDMNFPRNTGLESWKLNFGALEDYFKNHTSLEKVDKIQIK